MPRRRKSPWYRRNAKAIGASLACAATVGLLTILELRGVTSEALGVIAVAAATGLGTWFTPRNTE